MVRGQESPLSASPALATVKARARKAGLRFWMERVLEECDRVSAGFGPDPVHDLRVALRRCRSIADGFIALDPDPAWKEMKKAGRRLFSRLGELRDVHVMQEWVGKLASPSDPSAIALLQFLAAREIELKQEAALALNEFDRKQWRRWSIKLPRRTTRLRQGSMIFKHLALERMAARSRSASPCDARPLPDCISQAADRPQAFSLHRRKFPAGAACRVGR